MGVSQLASLLRAGRSDLTCGAVQPWLPGYLDGALPEAGRLHERVARHLDECESCRTQLEKYRAISRAMLSVHRAEPPDDLALSIRVAVSKARETGDFELG